MATRLPGPAAPAQTAPQACARRREAMSQAHPLATRIESTNERTAADDAQVQRGTARIRRSAARKDPTGSGCASRGGPGDPAAGRRPGGDDPEPAVLGGSRTAGAAGRDARAA